MHEEDFGLLWKHVDYRTNHSESRRSRRLVISFLTTVVNYEYLHYFYLMQDGTIEYEVCVIWSEVVVAQLEPPAP